MAGRLVQAEYDATLWFLSGQYLVLHNIAETGKMGRLDQKCACRTNDDVVEVLMDLFSLSLIILERVHIAGE